MYLSGAPTSKPLTLSEKNEIKVSVFAKNFAVPNTTTATTDITAEAKTNIPIATGFTFFFIFLSL